MLSRLSGVGPSWALAAWLCAPLVPGCGTTRDCPPGLVPYAGRCLALDLDAGHDAEAAADSGQPDGGEDAGGEGDAGGDGGVEVADRDGDGLPDETDPCPSTWDPSGEAATCEHRSIEGPTTIALASLLPDGRVVFTGAASGPSVEDLQPLTEVWLYDPTDDSTRTASDQTADYHIGGAAVRMRNGHVLFVGGGDLGGQLTSNIEEFEAWSEIVSGFGSLESPRKEHQAVRLADGRLLVVGGTTSDDTVAVRSLELFETDGTRTIVGSLPDEEGGEVAAVELEDGTVLITGGCTGADGGPKEPSTLALVLDPVGEGPTALPDGLVTGRTRHRMVRLPDDRVLIVGGDTECAGGGARATREVEIFDPDDGTFESLVIVPAYHHRGSLISLADGSALVSGGDADIELHIEEEMSRFDDSGLRDDAPLRPDELLEPRTFLEHGSVLLHDGSVLILGGITTGFTLAAGGERFFPTYLGPVDRDFDRVVDVLDNCPDDPNPDQRDSDRDGTGDDC